MALTPAFTISQSAINPAAITATDTSTGSDAAIASRRIYFQTSSGTYLVVTGTTTSYEVWSYADSTGTWSVLTTDQALNITVQWVDSGGTVLYSLSQLYCLSEFNQQFLVYLGQLQAITPGILQDANYAMNLTVYYSYIVYAIKMVEKGADISNSQNLLNKATYMMQNENYYF